MRAHAGAHARASAGRTGATSNRRRAVPVKSDNDADDARDYRGIRPAPDNDADDVSRGTGGRMAKPNAKAPLGQGGRFAALSQKLKSRGANDPDALAAYIGRKKYGAAKMGSMAARGRG